jgi:hypothetical protein
MTDEMQILEIKYTGYEDTGYRFHVVAAENNVRDATLSGVIHSLKMTIIVTLRSSQGVPYFFYNPRRTWLLYGSFPDGNLHKLATYIEEDHYSLISQVLHNWMHYVIDSALPTLQQETLKQETLRLKK